MLKNNISLIKLLLCALVISLVALSTHIVIIKHTGPILNSMTEGKHFPTANEYSFAITCWAYVTAFEQMLVVTIAYYFVGGLVKCRNLFKIALFSFFYLELFGNLLRMVFMNAYVAHTAGITSPILYGLLSQADKIVSALLMVTILVVWCPTKEYGFNQKTNLP